MLTIILCLLGCAVLWLLREIAGQMLGGLMGRALSPILRPVERAARRMLNRWTAALLWIAALASYALLPATLGSSSSAIRTAGFLAFLGMTPLALMATLAVRERRRPGGIVGRGDLYQPVTPPRS